MTTTLGNLSLCLAVVLAAVALIASVSAAAFESPSFARAASWAMGVLLGVFTLASAALTTALLQSDFHINYVARYTERALPVGYKIAAFWAGQEGSLLLWAWLQTAMGVLAVVLGRGLPRRLRAGMTGTLALACGFFAMLLLFAANPFAPSRLIPADGQGLNPMLQDPGMIAHPPFLFLGYAGFTIPFALVVGTLICGASADAGEAWLSHVRRWALAAWLFLSIGILLGAQWAYVELGWGGYWAWDPVENASLMPWLTATAFLHTLISQQRRGMFKAWNVTLIAVTFILCIFGTYLTRSGVVQSVHGFGASLVGTFFLAFLLLVTMASAALILWRSGSLRSEQPLEAMLSRDGVFLMGGVLLVAMTAATFVGTLFPVLSGLVLAEPASVGQPFYNKIVLPLGLALVALMALGPALVHGPDAAMRLVKRLRLGGGLAAAGAAVAWLAGLHSLWALACVAVVLLAVFNIVIDLALRVAQRMAETGANPAAALLHQLNLNPRRYGAQVTHLGVVFIVVGVAGSSLFSVNESVQLSPGATARVGNYRLQLTGPVQEVRGENYTAVEAVLTVTGPSSGSVISVRPQRRFYDKAENPSSQVAIESSCREDVYVTLAGWEADGQTVAVQVIVNPLVRWIWIGGVTLALGAAVCLLPRVVGSERAGLGSHLLRDPAPTPTRRPGPAPRHPRPETRDPAPHTPLPVEA